VVEDLHWIDPTSRDFLASLIDSIASTRILLLTTYRPGCEIPGLPRSHVSQLAVSRLLPRHSLAIVRGIATEGRVPDALAEAIVQKGAGNPFLLEELTWDLATRGGASAGIAVPDTIGEVLRARIDRLPAQDRGLLQAAAVIGRNVPFALLHAVSDVKEEDLRRGLGRLQAAEFLYQMGSAPDLEYTFRHALTQDVTYSSLPPEQRCRVHARIVTVIEQRAMGRIEEQIEQLAYHALRGEVWDKALAYSQQAGEKAAARSAHTEAIGHVTTALELLKNRPDARQRIPQELALQTTLGSALMATKGYAAPEVERAYARARALCQQVEETPELLRVLTGLHMFYRQRAELQTSYEVGKQLLTLAQSLRDPQFLLVARQALGTTSYFLGEFVQARAHLEEGVTLCDAGRPRSQAVLYGQDPGVICLATLARTLWALGYPDEALEKLQESLALARQLSHPFSLSFALYFAAVVYQYRREWRATQECAEALMALSTEHGFTQRAAQARILLGWTLVEQGRGAEGIAQLRESVAAYGATGADLGRSSYLALLAEAYGKGGHAEEGLTTLAEALTLVNKHRIGFNEAEIHRLKGELLLRHSAPTGGSGVEAGGPLALAETEPLVLAEVEACFRRALDVARRQQAKSLELRAAVSLSRLWQRQAKSAQARNLLTEIYGWFTQGFDTADLQEANALLEALG
jgi:predicted ATPase